MEQEEGEEGGCSRLHLPGYRKPQVNSPFKQTMQARSIICHFGRWKKGQIQDYLSLTTKGALGQSGLHEMVTKQQLQQKTKKHNHLHRNEEDDGENRGPHHSPLVPLPGHTLRLLVHCAEWRSSSFQLRLCCAVGNVNNNNNNNKPASEMSTKGGIFFFKMVRRIENGAGRTES